MTMNKFFAGLIAFVAGVALSAGSAFATAGYVGGDPAMMKLVPYYETGPMKATIIGIQNMSPQEASTMALHAAVTTAQDALDAENKKDSPDLTTVNNLEMDLADAMDAVQTEHVFIAVNVYNADGTMMENASTELCLAEHQFGYVVLQGPADMGTDGHQGAVLSMMDGDIPGYGYAEVVADGTKWSACDSASFRDPAVRIVTESTDDDPDQNMAQSRVASWTIIQDVGMGFFGTEVPNATLSMSMAPGIESTATGDEPDNSVAAGDPQLACYTTAVGAEAAVTQFNNEGEVTTAGTPGPVANIAGDFMMGRCGLIPERHDNSRITDEGDTQGDPDTIAAVADEDARAGAQAATPRAHAFARYDAGDESMVYVWLAEGDDATVMPHPSDSRTLDVDIKCEDGTVISTLEDMYGDPQPIEVAAPNKLTMLDPTMGTLGDATAMCAGDRGVLQITMPDGSTAGMVFSHITQMGGHYRMNFPGYGMANPMTCYEMGQAHTGDADGNGTPDQDTDKMQAAVNACM